MLYVSVELVVFWTEWQNLSSNEIKDLAPLAGMDYLIFLDASNNKIKKLSFENTPFLQYINAMNNEIESMDIISLPLLGVLNLNGMHSESEEITRYIYLQETNSLSLIWTISQTWSS